MFIAILIFVALVAASPANELCHEIAEALVEGNSEIIMDYIEDAASRISNDVCGSITDPLEKAECIEEVTEHIRDPEEVLDILERICDIIIGDDENDNDNDDDDNNNDNDVAIVEEESEIETLPLPIEEERDDDPDDLDDVDNDNEDNDNDEDDNDDDDNDDNDSDDDDDDDDDEDNDNNEEDVNDDINGVENVDNIDNIDVIENTNDADNIDDDKYDDIDDDEARKAEEKARKKAEKKAKKAAKKAEKKRLKEEKKKQKQMEEEQAFVTLQSKSSGFDEDKFESDVGCNQCKVLFEALENFANDDEQVKNFLNNAFMFCAKLRDDLRDECNIVIPLYAPYVVDALRNGLPPERLCVDLERC